MAKKYVVGNPQELPEGVPIKSRVNPDGTDTHFYPGDDWYPGPGTTPGMIANWVQDGSLIEVDNA